MKLLVPELLFAVVGNRSDQIQTVSIRVPQVFGAVVEVVKTLDATNVIHTCVCISSSVCQRST